MTENVMTENVMTEMTLECLMNKTQYAKYISQSQGKSNNKIINKKEKKFYKRRIFDLTKQLLNNEKPKMMFPDVSSAFDSYVKVCIEYFKALDKTDIIQSDYDGFIDELGTGIGALSESEQAELNKLLMRSIKITEPNALEKLVKRTTTKICQKAPIIPMQKDINLKDPVLKNKGIRKKNNINNKYEESSEKKETDETDKTK
uniref:Uncharacterized protein n=1 Tax=viral metagenome TaxID=1070528 RepID=A0A6C0K369_9ZZZZ